MSPRDVSVTRLASPNASNFGAALYATMTLTVENTTQNSLEHPNIFIDTSGSPLKIYVDITGIPRRVRLIRALRVSLNLTHLP